MTKKQARAALLTKANVGEGSKRYRYADPLLHGCFGLIELPLDTLGPITTVQAGYHGEALPFVHHLIRSYDPERSDVESAFTEIGRAIAECEDVDIERDSFLYELAVAPTRPIKGLPAARQHSYAAVGTITDNADSDRVLPYGFKMTYLRAGTSIIRVTTTFLAPVVQYHNAAVKIAMRRYDAVLAGEKPKKEAAPPIPRR